MMDDEVSDPRAWPCLLEAQPASSKISDMISMALQLPANVMSSLHEGASRAALLRLAVGDVVVFLEARSTANTLALSSGSARLRTHAWHARRVGACGEVSVQSGRQLPTCASCICHRHVHVQHQGRGRALVIW